MKNRSKLRSELISKLVCIECYSPMEGGDSTLTCKNCNTQYPLIENELAIFTKHSMSELSSHAYYQLPNTYLSKLKKDVEAFIRSKLFLFRMTKILIKVISEVTHPIRQIRRLFGFIPWFPILFLLKRKSKDSKNVKKNHELEECLNGLVEANHPSPYAWYLKSLEAYYFRQYYPQAPSLEFGGGRGETTYRSYGGQCRITYGSEIFANFLVGKDRSLRPDIYKVYDSLFVSLATKLPIPSEYLSTVISIHILDHVIEVEDLFKEVSRVLRKGGLFIASTYSRNVYKGFPDFWLLSRFSFLSDKYINWRLRRKNVRSRAAYIREGSYANGQNILSLGEWKRLAGAVGLRVNKVIPFTHNWLFALLMDVEYQGFRCPGFLRKAILGEVKKFAFQELVETPKYEESGNVFFVFEKV